MEQDESSPLFTEIIFIADSGDAYEPSIEGVYKIRRASGLSFTAFQAWEFGTFGLSNFFDDFVMEPAPCLGDMAWRYQEHYHEDGMQYAASNHTPKYKNQPVWDAYLDAMHDRAYKLRCGTIKWRN